MDDNTFWVHFLRVAGSVVSIIALCITFYCVYQTNLYVDAVTKGANPLDIACINPDRTYVVVCAARAGK